MRQPGYYWCKYDGEWTVAEWDSPDWYKSGIENVYEDSDFEEIDERRIERQPIVDNSKCDIQPPTEEELRMMAEFNSLPLIEPND